MTNKIKQEEVKLDDNGEWQSEFYRVYFSGMKTLREYQHQLFVLDISTAHYPVPYDFEFDSKETINKSIKDEIELESDKVLIAIQHTESETIGIWAYSNLNDKKCVQ